MQCPGTAEKTVQALQHLSRTERSHETGGAGMVEWLRCGCANEGAVGGGQNSHLGKRQGADFSAGRWGPELGKAITSRSHPNSPRIRAGDRTLKFIGPVEELQSKPQ